MRVLTFPHSFHYKIEHIDFVLDIFCLCFNSILYGLYPVLYPRRLMNWYRALWLQVGLGHLGKWEEYRRREEDGVGGLHFLGSLPWLLQAGSIPYGKPQPLFGLWHLRGVLSPSCRVGDEPTVSSCYCCSIPPCFSCPSPSNNFSINLITQLEVVIYLLPEP